MYVDDKQVGERQVALEPWRKVLLDAADLLNSDGHCKGALQRGRAHCVLGAMVKASGGYLGQVRQNEQFRAALLKLKSSVGHPSGWNNAPERTAAEVIATLRAVAQS